MVQWSVYKSSHNNNNSNMFARVCVLLAAVPVLLVLSQDVSLPGGSEDILFAPYVDSFSCEGRDYGYYADPDNNCQVFHVCLPIEDNDGAIVEYAKYSLVCGNATIFDQATLSCNYPENSMPCEEAPSLYNTIEYGLKVEE